MAKPKSKPKAKKLNPLSAVKNPLSGLLKRGSKPAAKNSSKQASAKKPPAKKTATAPPPPPGMSLDRKLDIVGVALTLFGLLTLLSLLSPNRSGFTNAWVAFWRTLLGWGVYVFPIMLVLLGVWLIARNFDSVPRLDIERVIGFLVIFIMFLIVLHALITPNGEGIDFQAAANQMVAEERGGGRLGSALMVFLATRLGIPGMVVVILAGAVIGLAMLLDVPVVDLFAWLPRLVLRIQDAWDEWQVNRHRKAHTTAPEMPLSPEKTYAPPLNPIHTGPEAPPTIPTAQTLSPLAQAVMERTDWVLPKIEDILEVGAELAQDDDFERDRAQMIEETLASFGAPATVVEINRGPTITQFGVEPDYVETNRGRTRVRVSKIAGLADDLSLALSAQRIRIQAPVPGKGYIGIEVPNDQISVVALRDVIESAAFARLHHPLRFGLGQDVAGNAVAADLSRMPHLLVAGATGSGKSVCVNGIITCLMLHNTPNTLRFIMIDPKRVELTGYNGIPHLLAPVVTDLERVVGVLQWVTREMDSRYQKFADVGSRNIDDYNRRAESGEYSKLPFLVVVIDELADLMMVSPDQTERLITRMAQLARATGIHMIISTQRPSVDVVTGLIKANFPARISFAVASGTDSRVIIDQPGAERLLGRGDMLFQAPDAPAPVRMQGIFVSDPEILRAVQYWRAFAGTTSMAPIPTGAVRDELPNGVPLVQKAIWEEMEEQEEEDPKYAEAVELVRRRDRASISMLQKRLKIGYTRAARMIERMEEDGIIGPPTEGSKPRDVLDYGESDMYPDEGDGD